MKGLKSGDRVLVVGTSCEPQMCTKKDEKAFMGFWDKHLFLPVPDYASRRVESSNTFTWEQLQQDMFKNNLQAAVLFLL